LFVQIMIWRSGEAELETIHLTDERIQRGQTTAMTRCDHRAL